jgi:septal ring factor EnvC (AmiA/AmiB activator)
MLRLAIRSLAVAAALCCGWIAFAAGAHAQSEDALREGVSEDRERERELSGAAARLKGLIGAVEREVGLLEGRLAEAQEELAAAQAREARTVERRDAARERAARLRERLEEAQDKLATILDERYRSPGPGLVTVVLRADGFADLLETVEFLERVQAQDESVVDEVRTARAEAIRERRRFTRLAERQREETAAVQRRRDALAGVAAGLRERRAELREARAARLDALGSVRADRRRGERRLERLLKRRERQARQTRGPGGPWAIPYAIVQCESGGVNHTPNSAGASGYYQFLPETWAGLGGSTKHAHQAPKAEQDRLAAKLWAGGAGAGNWVCAALVGQS